MDYRDENEIELEERGKGKQEGSFIKGISRRTLIIIIVSISVVAAFCCLCVIAPMSFVGISYIVFPQKLSYEPHLKRFYSFEGNVRSQGQDTEDTFDSMKINGTLVVHCLVVDQLRQSYIFQLNLMNVSFYNTTGTGQEDLVQHVPTELGEWLFFNQSFSGEILEIVKPADEDDSFALKVNLINNFQTIVETSIFPRKFFDTNGVYSGVLSYGMGSGLSKTITKNINQKDFQAFSDKDVNSPKDDDLFFFKQKTVHTIGQNGRIEKIEVESNTQYTKGGTKGEKGELESVGDMKINFLREEIENIFPEGLPFSDSNTDELPSTKNVRRIFDPLPLNRREGKKSELYVKGDLSEMGLFLVQQMKNGKELDDTPTTISFYFGILNGAITNDDQLNDAIYAARKLVKLYQISVIAFTNDFEPQITTPGIWNAKDDQHVDLYYYILTGIGNARCIELLVTYGLESTVDSRRLLAVMSARDLIEPSPALVTKLTYIYSHDSVVDIKNAALLSYAILVKRLPQTQRRSGEEFLLNVLRDNIETFTNSEIKTILYSIQNAGIKIDEDSYYTLLERRNIHISKLAHSLLEEKNRRSIHDIPVDDDSTFPYNKSDEYDKKVGTKYASGYFYAGYFAGADYFCNYDYFNFRAYAEFYGDGEVLGDKKRLLWAKVHYEKVRGVLIGNELFLQIFGKTVYQRDIPYLDCKKNYQNIFQTSKGFAISYTVVIVWVPVTFQIGADLHLNLDWSWTVCDAILRAEVTIEPGAALVVYGNAAINLFLIKGGVEAAANINGKLVPTAFIDGTICEVGVYIDLIVNPFQIDLYLFYQLRGCSYKFPFKLKCGWKSKNKLYIWGHKEPTIHKRLFTKTWSIKSIIRRNVKSKPNKRKTYLNWF